MKIIILITVITGLIIIAKLSNYKERIEHINARQCAVWGYEADCKTRLGGDK